MNNELTFERYQALNRTFRKELIFHLGSDAGFYSEFNNMILAIMGHRTKRILRIERKEYQTY